MAFDLVGKAVRKFKLPTVCYDNVPIKVIPAQAGDVNSRFFDIEIYDDRGAIDLRNYETVIFNAKLPNGSLEMYAGVINIEENCAIIKVPSSVIKEAGKVVCDISLKGHDGSSEAVLLTTQKFYLIVSESQVSDEAIEATNEYGLLLELLEDLTELENEVKESEQARNAAEILRESNESERINQENLRISAENSRELVENDRVNAENERINAELKRVNNEATRENNEIERSTAEIERKKAEVLRQTAESNRESEELIREEAEQNRNISESARVSSENERNEAESLRQTGYEEMKEIIDSITDGSGTVQHSERATCDDEGNIIKETYAKIDNVVRKDVSQMQEIKSALKVGTHLYLEGTINDEVAVEIKNGEEKTIISRGGIICEDQDGVGLSVKNSDGRQVAIGVGHQEGASFLQGIEVAPPEIGKLEINPIDLGNSLLPWKDLYLSGKIIGGLISREEYLPSANADDSADLVAIGDDLYWKAKAGGWQSSRGTALQALFLNAAIVNIGVGEYDIYSFGGHENNSSGNVVDTIQKIKIRQRDMSIEVLNTKFPVKTFTFAIYVGNNLIYVFTGEEIYKFNINTEEISKLEIDCASGSAPLGIISGKIYMSINNTNDIKILDVNTDSVSDFPAKLQFEWYATMQPSAPINTSVYNTKIYLYGGCGWSDEYKKIQIIDTESETIELLETTIPNDGYDASYIVANKDITSEEYSNGAIIRAIFRNSGTGEYYYSKWYYHNYETNEIGEISLPDYTSYFSLIFEFGVLGFQYIGLCGYDYNTQSLDIYPVRYVKQDNGFYQKINPSIFVGGTRVNSLVFETDPQTAINLRYIKPENGIPTDDLSTDVVESLNLAKSALQNIPDNLLISGENITIEKNEEGSYIISSTAGSLTWVPTLISEEEYLAKLEAGQIDENTVYYIEGTSDSKLTVEISEQQLADLIGIETNQIDILASVATGLSAEEVTKLIALLSGLNSTQIQNLVDAAKIISVTSVDGVQCLTAPGFNEV